MGYWKFDEGTGTTAYDSSGHGNHGTLTNGPTWSENPSNAISFENPYALSFDGVDDYVIGDAIDPTAEQGSITAWFKTDTSGANLSIFSNYDEDEVSDSNAFFWMYLNSTGNLKCRIRRTNGGGYDETTTSAYNDGNWHQATVIYDGGSSYEFYVDGSAASHSVTDTDEAIGWFYEANQSAGLDRFSIGSLDVPRISRLYYFNGILDDVRIYNRALSATEIAELAAGNHTTAIWDGSSSTNWETAANWDINAVPDPFTHVIIPDTANDPQMTTTNSGASITVVSNASLDLHGHHFELTESGSIKGGGTVKLIGNQTIDNASYTGTGTVLYYGTGSYTGLAMGNAYQNLTLNDGLVGYWKFDEGTGTTAYDSSGHGNHGTLTNMNSADWVAPNNPVIQYSNPYALEFDGSDDYVNAGDKPQFDAELTNGFTVLFWFNAASYPTGASGNYTDAICGKWKNSTDDRSWAANFGSSSPADTDSLSVAVSGNGGVDIDAYVAGSTNLALYTWYHGGISYDGNSIDVWINGAHDGTTAYSNGIYDSAADMVIGGIEEWGNQRQYFAGLIDDLRIYNRVLSPSEVANLAVGNYANGTSGVANYTLNSNLDISGSLTLHSGILSADSSTIDVAGDWNNYGGTGSFVAGTSTVDLDGSATQTMRGSTDFYNLELSTSAARTVKFGSGTTQGISNSLTITGAAGNLLTLSPLPAGAKWFLNVTSALVSQVVSYVSVSFSDASQGTAIDADDGTNTNGGSNVNWVFTSSPAAPTITSPVSGISTHDTTPAISGTGSAAGNTIRVYSGATVLCSTTVNGDAPKPWSCTSSSLSDGAYTIHATEDNGGESGASDSITFTVDTTAPMVSTLSPADDATGVSVTANLVIEFSESIGKSGTGTVTIKKASDDSVVETIAVTGSLVTGSGTDTITINPSVTLAYSTAYYVQIDSMAFPDASGNFYAGISDTTSWSFTTGAAPASPTSTDTEGAAEQQPSGGSRGGHDSAIMQRIIAAAQATILARYEGKRETELLIVQEEESVPDALASDEERRQYRATQKRREAAIAQQELELELAAQRREERIAQRIAAYEAEIVELQEALAAQYAERREERMTEALALQEQRLAEQQVALAREQEALTREQEQNRQRREKRLAERERLETLYAAAPVSDPSVVAARRGRLFAYVGSDPVIYGDVETDAWYAPYVSYVVEEQIATGYADEEGNPKGEFGVGNPVTYAEVLKMAMQASDETFDLRGLPPPRNATARGTWAAAYVAKAEEMGLGVVTPDGNVHEPATRGEVVQTILQIMRMPTGIKIASPFTDVRANHPFAGAIITAAAYGLVQGDTDSEGNPLGSFRPDDPINRAEVAKIIALVKEVMR